MRVLFLVSRFPYPPHRGDRITTYGTLRALARRHAVTLLSFVDGTEAPGARAAIEPLCEHVETVRLSRARSWVQAWAGLPFAEPSQVSYYASGAMRAAVARRLAATRFDAVLVHLIRMAPFVRRAEHPCKVLFLADSLALSLGRSAAYQPAWKRPGLAWERARVARFEAASAADFTESWVLSDVDRRDLESRGAPRVRTFAQGIDERLFDVPLVPHGGEVVTFLGNLSVPHNVDAATVLAREVMPLVRRERPGAVLEIVGADPRPAVRELGALPGVRVIGPVPDLVPVWARTAVSVAPLRYSAGIQNKLLEALAAGVPVVTTPDAAQAIGARDGEHVWIGRDPASLAAATLEVLADPGRAFARADAGRRLVREGFSWETLVRRLEDLVAAHPA